MSTLPAGVRRLGSRLVSFFLLEEDGRATLVDAGAPGYGRQIDAEASGRIDAVVLTHAHADHVGVAEILRTELGVPVYVHEADAESARSAKATSYDDELDVPGKLRAIHTPGHTAGHCVLLSEPSGALFAGDAICTLNPLTGEHGPQMMPKAFTSDVQQALASLDRIADPRARVILPGHGGPAADPAAAVEAAKRRGPT